MTDHAVTENATSHVPDRFEDIGKLSFTGRFGAGLRFAVGGVKYTLSHPELRSLSIIPMLINAVLFAGLVWFGFMNIPDLVAWADLGIDEASFWHFLQAVVSGAVWLVAILGVVLGGFFLTIVIGNVLAGPIYDVLSERTEKLTLGRSAAAPFTMAGFVHDLFQELMLTVIRLGVYFAGVLVLLLLGLLPLVGQVAGTALGPPWSWLFVAMEICNPSFARHRLKGAGRVSQVLGQKATYLGFGLGAWALLWIPVTMPFLVVAGTRLHLALAAWDHAPSALDEADKALLRQA